MALRTFIALDLDADLRKRVGAIAAAFDSCDAKVRWTDPAQLHVTLSFLGDVQDNMMAQVCSTVADVSGRIEPFEFEVRGVEPVPPEGRQLRMFWVGIAETAGRLATLHDALAEALADLGYRPEARRFRPHITLARVKSVRDAQALRDRMAVCRDERFGRQLVGEVITYTSMLTSAGPVHTPAARAPLGG